jgi:hypothetical protein
MPDQEDQRLVTVCSACKQASCWQGKFYCDHYKTAGTVRLTIEKLRRLDLEHPYYWHPDCEAGLR